MIIRRVVGKSMEPALYEGDIVVFRKRRPGKRDVVLAHVNGREIVKRVRSISKKTADLRGDNTHNSTDSRTYGRIPVSSIKGTMSYRIRRRMLRLVTFSFCMMSLAILATITVPSVFIKSSKSEAVSQAPEYARPLLPKTYFTAGTTINDIEYCNGQLADISYPRTDPTKKAPVVIYMHGGGWFRDNKNSQPTQLAMVDGLRDKGVAIMTINYRLAPQFTYPAAIDDGRCAVRFVRSQAEKYGFDGSKIAAFGFSAGGHLAAMMGTVDDDSLFAKEPYPGISSKVSVVVSIAGLFSFEDALQSNNIININRMMAGQTISEAQPMFHVSKGDAPTLLLHGTEDKLVSLRQDDLYAQKLLENNVLVQSLIVQNAIHGLESADGSPTSPTTEEISKTIQDFILKNW